MEAERKTEVLHGIIRKMMADGADIQTDEWLEFVEAAGICGRIQGAR
jgi:hypothetical protein